eukprot:4040277-Pleurochrysis_carterae.AAC.2
MVSRPRAPTHASAPRTPAPPHSISNRSARSAPSANQADARRTVGMYFYVAAAAARRVDDDGLGEGGGVVRRKGEQHVAREVDRGEVDHVRAEALEVKNLVRLLKLALRQSCTEVRRAWEVKTRSDGGRRR